MSEKDKRSIRLIWNLKNNMNGCICKANTLTNMRNKLVVTKGERKVCTIRGMVFNRYRLPCIKYIT